MGVTMAADQVAHVVSVSNGSPAAKAGVQAGDDFVSLAGQPLISIADVSWILHRAPDSGELPAVVRRSGEEKSLTISLPAGWRSKADISRRVGTWQMRGMAAGGLSLEDLGDDARRERGLDAQKMALFVKAVGQYGIHAAGKNAGFQKEDVIVELAGASNRMSESEVLGWLLQNHLAGERVKASVLRGQQRLELSLPMQ
jgi:S1-C subfamily serine protease